MCLMLSWGERIRFISSADGQVQPSMLFVCAIAPLKKKHARAWRTPAQAVQWINRDMKNTPHKPLMLQGS